MKNILFLGYWGANDGLSQATISPHLSILSEMALVDKIYYVSMERGNEENFKSSFSDKIVHCPYYTGTGLLSKAKDFLFLPIILIRLIKSKNISILIARSSLAGGIGYLATRMLRIPYFVESFEPHAQYMLEANVWKKSSLSYQVARFLEKKQLSTASGIFPVSNAYARDLESNYPMQWISTAPCAVNNSVFKFSVRQREAIRTEYDIPTESIVGIYVGKFGGNYLNEEAFDFFSIAFDEISGFFLIILCPENHEFISRKLSTKGVSESKFIVTSTSHDRVSGYLSAADFGFALYKPGKSKRAISSIKVGEYWACGLPVVITTGIGDEDQILERYDCLGVKFHLSKNSMESALATVLNKIHQREEIANYARKLRGFESIKDIYCKIIE